MLELNPNPVKFYAVKRETRECIDSQWLCPQLKEHYRIGTKRNLS